MRRISLIVFSVLVLLARCFCEYRLATPGSIRGEVVTKTRNGEPAVLPDARIVLHGPINKEPQTDARGAFAIDGLPPGMYDIGASAPGLNATLAVEVKPGTTLVVPIELGTAIVVSEVTVAASEPALAEESGQKHTIGGSTVRAAPNQDEKIDSLVPLVAGVVWGPDGRINMIGIQATQARWLVNRS